LLQEAKERLEKARAGLKNAADVDEEGEGEGEEEGEGGEEGHREDNDSDSAENGRLNKKCRYE
jgi:hypothetical protein